VERVAIRELYLTKKAAHHELMARVQDIQGATLMGDDVHLVAETIRRACESITRPSRRFATAMAAAAVA